jgi:hypothetical protein
MMVHKHSSIFSAETRLPPVHLLGSEKRCAPAPNSHNTKKKGHCSADTTRNYGLEAGCGAVQTTSFSYLRMHLNAIPLIGLTVDTGK